MGQASLLLLQARTLARSGMFKEALQTADQTMAWIERTGARSMEADVWRVRGELLLAIGGYAAKAVSGRPCAVLGRGGGLLPARPGDLQGAGRHVGWSCAPR